MAAPPKSSPLLGPADTIPGRGRLRRSGPPRPDRTGPSVRAGSVAHRDHRGTSGSLPVTNGKEERLVDEPSAQAARTTPGSGSDSGPEGQARSIRRIGRRRCVGSDTEEDGGSTPPAPTTPRVSRALQAKAFRWWMGWRRGRVQRPRSTSLLNQRRSLLRARIPVDRAREAIATSTTAHHAEVGQDSPDRP